ASNCHQMNPCRFFKTAQTRFLRMAGRTATTEPTEAQKRESECGVSMSWFNLKTNCIVHHGPKRLAPLILGRGERHRARVAQRNFVHPRLQQRRIEGHFADVVSAILPTAAIGGSARFLEMKMCDLRAVHV